MTETSTVFTSESESARAGEELGAGLAQSFGDRHPDAVVVFAGPLYDHHQLLEAVKATCTPAVMIGCSSAGEFTMGNMGENSACAVGIASDDIEFTAVLGCGVNGNTAEVARSVVQGFQGLHRHDVRYRTALVLADALAGHLDGLVEGLALETSGTYKFFGGAAGDNAAFQQTPVFFDTTPYSDAVVALEMLSRKPIGVGVQHGWEPATAGMRVTHADGMRLYSLNAVPAADALAEHAARTGQRFNRDDPLPFFLHNILGIESGGRWRLRVPLQTYSDGSILCAAEIPEGSVVAIMRAPNNSAAGAAQAAVQDALSQLQGEPAQVVFFFDCVATRLRLGREFGGELGVLQHAVGDAQVIGCNTHGQIARAEGQFSGFHNCTAVVCALPS